MKRLIVDASPIFYSNLISATTEVKRQGAKPVNGVIPIDYEDIIIFKVFEELASLRQYTPDEIIFAIDNSRGGYWRKDFYDRYKYGRKEGRAASDIDWDAGFEVFDKISNALLDSSYRVLSIPRLEADDIAFVLSEYFADNPNDQTVLYTIDQDWQHNLAFDNVIMYRTRKTQRKSPILETSDTINIPEKARAHCIAGDPGDGFLHIKSWTQFSPEFLVDYPKFKGKELEVYDKHHQIEKMYTKKMEAAGTPKIQAYKHPRFGYKSFEKSKTTLKELLNQNPIHKKNFQRNKRLCLPSGIPEDYKQQVIEAYKASSAKPNYKNLQKFFSEHRLFELQGNISKY